MPALLIETSTEKGIVAISEGKAILKEIHLPHGYQSSKFLLPEIQNCLKETKVQMSELQYIAVGIGPGSYTGIRVGVAAAKAIAFARDLPLIGLCTLKTFVPTEKGAFAVLIDAKVSGAYAITGFFKKEITYDTQPNVWPLEKLEKLLETHPLILTPQKVPLQTKIEKLYPHSKWHWEETSPSSQQMAQLAEVLFAAKEYVLDGHLKILYLRD